MMLITRYFKQTIFFTIAVVFAALAGLEVFILFISQLRDIGMGNFTLAQALWYVLLILPAKLYSFFPMIGLLGTLLGLGVLASHSELIVMRAAGLSLAQIIRTLLKIAFSLVLIISLIGETIAPLLLTYAEKRKALAVSSGQALKTGQGVWIRDGQNFFHIVAIKDAHHIEAISRYQLDQQHRLVLSSFAKRAAYLNKHWLFEDIQQIHISEAGTRSDHLDKQVLSLSLKPDLLKMVAIEPMDMTIQQLYQTILYHSLNGLHVASYSLAFWQRLWQPVATLVMMLLAIPFIFGPLQAANLGLRLLAGISLGFGFYILNEFFGPISLVMQLPPFLAAILPSLIFMVVGIILMQRTR